MTATLPPSPFDRPPGLRDGRYFKVADFASHDGVPYPVEWADRWELLITLADLARDLWGGPLFAVSGYRSPAHNTELIIADEGRGVHGVASSSQHVEGNAADLRTGRWAFDVEHLHRVVLVAHQDGKLPQLGGLGLYRRSGWIHVDTLHAPDGHLRRWIGT